MDASAELPGQLRTGGDEAERAASLSVRGLVKTFVSHLRGGERRCVLDGVELDVPAGACVVVTGPSGSGKSSLLRCVYGTYLPDSGSVRVRWREQGVTKEVDVAGAAERAVLALRRDVIGLATQFLSVTPRVAAVDLVAQAVAPRASEGNGLHAAREMAAERLRSLGLPRELISAPPATFSGGERQMLNLALALAKARPLILLDEVTASLDPQRRRIALEAIRARKQAGTTLLAVFHDVPELPGLVDEVVRMENGKVVAG